MDDKILFLRIQHEIIIIGGLVANELTFLYRKGISIRKNHEILLLDFVFFCPRGLSLTRLTPWTSWSLWGIGSSSTKFRFHRLSTSPAGAMKAAGESCRVLRFLHSLLESRSMTFTDVLDADDAWTSGNSLMLAQLSFDIPPISLNL